MLSRAHLLIERDFEQLQKAKPLGITAQPIRDDNIFEWTATIGGLPGTPWEGGLFQLRLKFTELYNSVPPDVYFLTIPYHPNVDVDTGRPCVSSLQTSPSPDSVVHIMEILQSVQRMLSSPVLEDAVNHEACEMLRETPATYHQVVLQCVANSQRLKDDSVMHPDITPVHLRPQISERIETPQSQDKPLKPRVGQVLFEDYYFTWAGIATSKCDIEEENPFVKSLEKHPTLQQIHYGAHADEVAAQRQRLEEERKELVYGRIKQSKDKEEEEKQEKLNYINQMRRTYLMAHTPRQYPNSPRQTSCAECERGRTQLTDEWEEEADELVKWSNSLDEETL